MTSYRILAINPGSTSTKIAIYDGLEQVTELTLRHTSEELQRFSSVTGQFDWRKQIVVEAVEKAGIKLDSIDGVIGRGGLVRPIPSGVYEINDALRADLTNSPIGEHASNLGGLIADSIAGLIGARAFIADPVVVDEMQEVARVSGLPTLPRKSIFHALNQKAIARCYALKVGRQYEDMNLVIAHLGGGISVGAHCKGSVIDVNNALDGEGAFSPERAGTLPAGELVELCMSGKHSHQELRKMLCGEGGIVAHLNTNDTRDVLKMIENGDSHAQLIMDAMCYGVGKQIGAMAAVLHGRVDAVILTGGIAHSTYVCDYIKQMVGFISEVVVMAGENELEALAENALRVLEGRVAPMVYQPKK